MALRVATARRRIRVRGTVQGVGFRPFVYRHARALGLAGAVRNDGDGVSLEVEGAPHAIDELCRLLAEEPPPLARVESVEGVDVTPTGETEFRIVASEHAEVATAPVSVDVATCDDCLAELFDPANRRYRYPFVNCTNCGPRYTITLRIPYDRPATTMAGFPMCPSCQREYDHPSDRRFHAQPNACPVCGPHLRFTTPTGEVLAERGDALSAAVEALLAGRIVAVKGVGGYHLACDATSDAAVGTLRRRKARDDKPFALMVADLDSARALCVVDESVEAALTSHRRPIVLAPRRSGARVATTVAPGLAELGLVLPYSPLHHLLVADVARPLVMTSGNIADEPIAHEDAEAIERLGPLVDGVLAHDRPIHIRCDDSVVRATGVRPQMVRRSRGYAPEPMRLPAPPRRQVLALGAQLKSTIAVVNRDALIASHHIGDLEHLETYRSFLQAVDHLRHLYRVEPDVVAHDLHPEYLSTKLACTLDLPTWPVQHHHAHIASCLAEHGRSEPVLGLAFDGLGYGTDGTLWGGELLVADLQGFTRVGHLRTVALPGGAAAIREPWRMAVTWVAAALGADAAGRIGTVLDDRTPQLLALVERGDSLVTSSVGRLLDAVAALCGLRTRVTYEGQAAIELEAAASGVALADAPVYPVDVIRDGDQVVLDPAPLVAALVAERERGTPVPVLAAGVHAGIARATARAATAAANAHGLDTVALSGGVFQNARLTELVGGACAAAGLRVLVHEKVPPNDGGISVGQAAIAAFADAPTAPEIGAA